ncbi:MAG: hypothetical protein SF029_26690 [bacterium]|nr:hypothetical protein [bacterium]
MMFNETQVNYGNSTGIFVARKSSGNAIVLGGETVNHLKWARVLSYRAAQILWLCLGQLLYPQKAADLTSRIRTAPLRTTNQPSITTHISVEMLPNGRFNLIGWVGSSKWQAQITRQDMQEVWTALDSALFQSTPYNH